MCALGAGVTGHRPLSHLSKFRMKLKEEFPMKDAKKFLP